VRRVAAYLSIGFLVPLSGCGRNGLQKSQHFLVEYTPPHTADDAHQVLGILEEAAGELKTKLAYRPPSRVRVILYSASPEFSAATGKPGWFGAVYDGKIHLQPIATLQRRGVLRSSLRHEYVHLLFHTYVRAPTPLWFEEGFAEFFAESPDGVVRRNRPIAPPEGWESISRLDRSREETEQFYGAAADRVRRIAEAGGWARLREIFSALAAGRPFDEALGKKRN